MEEFIHKYLDENYIVEYCNDFYIKEPQSDNIKMYLCDELINIFAITKEEVKLFTKSWCDKQLPNVNLARYWAASEVRGMNGLIRPITTKSQVKKGFWKDILSSGRVQ